MLLLIGVISSCSNNEDNIPVDDYLTTNEAIPAYHGLTYTCLIMTDVL